MSCDCIGTTDYGSMYGRDYCFYLNFAFLLLLSLMSLKLEESIKHPSSPMRSNSWLCKMVSRFKFCFSSDTMNFYAWLLHCVDVRVLTELATFFQSLPHCLRAFKKLACSYLLHLPSFGFPTLSSEIDESLHLTWSPWFSFSRFLVDDINLGLMLWVLEEAE